MIAFSALSALSRSLLALGCLFTCYLGIADLVLSIRQKRWRAGLTAFLSFAPAYLLRQVFHDLLFQSKAGGAAALSLRMGEWPWLSFLAVLLLLTLAELLLLRSNLRYGKSALTPGTIKLCVDEMSCAVCYWRENGRVLLSNTLMNRLSLALSGSPLLNGNSFRDALPGEIVAAEGRMWRFACRDFDFNGETIHEMIASDISDLYAKTEKLRQDSEELSRLKRDLQAYSLNMDDMVRRSEVLKAKENIHDEMNRLLLSTVSTGSEEEAKLDEIFSLWERNALLLCREPTAQEDTHAAGRVRALAETLGIALRQDTELSASMTEKQRRLFFAVAQEAVINAAKHARATQLRISFEETDRSILCSFENDGAIPQQVVRFTGGLANTEHRIRELGGELFVRTGESFVLCLRFPK